MLAGEIPVSNGVILTDGFILLHNPESFGERRCLCSNYIHVGGVLLQKLRAAIDVERHLIESPFRFEKVSTKLRKLCKEHSVEDEFKRSFITIGEAVFDTRRLINAFEAVGGKVCGYLANTTEHFNGSSYLIIEPTDYDSTKNACAILLQSRKAGD